MTTGAATIVPGLPNADGWDFGDAPYFLEPLWLPGAADADSGTTLPEDDLRLESLCRKLTELAEKGQVSSGPAEPVPLDRLYWFRWITGHQVSFALWQLMARALDDAESVRTLKSCILAYGGMLLYTSSTPRTVYHDLIRPSMALQHPGFSGSWAPDYPPVRALLRGRTASARSKDTAEELRQAVRTVQLIHADVAARLVPDGASLLQLASQSTASHTPRHDRGVLYDNYFIVLRGPVAPAAVLTQLLRRLNAVAIDLSVNGLYPCADGRNPDQRGPDASVHEDVAECERNLARLLADVARQVAGNGLPL
jgi:L-tyrosine peroxygenase